MYQLPILSGDTFGGLSGQFTVQLPWQQLLASAQQPNAFSNFLINNALGFNRAPNLGGFTLNNSANSTAPGFDNWRLPAGTVRGILDPLPGYQFGTGPTSAQMGYTGNLPSYVRPGFTVPQELLPIINEAAQSYHMDPELIKAIIKQESNFNPRSLSSAGAAGYMQLMPSTAQDAGVRNRWDARENILGATRYIRHIYDKYGNWPLTLAAYNSGPNRRSIRMGTIPNIQETRDYVRRVMAYWGKSW